VNQAPDRLWPTMREFWQESGFLVQMESPETGILETDWAENRAKIPMDALRKTLGKAFDSLYSTGERDKFRMRLEPVAGGTEVYISHRGMIEVYATAEKDGTVWQPRPSDPELEAEFLRRLMLKLGVDQDRARAQVASLAPGATGGAATASLVSMSAAGDALDVREGFDRAWRRVGLALDRGGFTVEDRDRSQGVFFVRYIDPEIDAASTAKPGFFARMFSSAAKARANAQQFRVKVGTAGEQVRVTVQGKDGSALASDVDRKTGSRILALLREQLQ
jgi:outer membrane protein assembly factor BamC